MPDSLSPPAARRPSRAARPRFQFSLAWLLIVVTVTCVVLGLSTTLAWSIVVLIVTSIVRFILPAVLVACIIYGRGDFQAFAIGASVPFASLVVGSGSVPGIGGFAVLVYLPLISGVCGVLATLTRRWILQYG
jgi:hypothetical protein